MRTDPRYSRVRTMLADPAIPRTHDGGLALCHWCQRETYWRGGFIKLLVRSLERAARFPTP